MSYSFPVTVIEVIKKSTEFLARKGVDSPRLQSELLLAHVLSRPRLDLYLQFERALSKAQEDALRKLIQQRATNIPLQYLIGTTSFCGYDFQVGPAALIPRPETELLAERAWTFLETFAASQPGPRVLDFGTGTGCLAITIGLKIPRADVTAIDLSLEALELARRNAATLGANGNVRFLQSDAFAGLAATEKFDLIVANPPYIPTLEIDHLAPEVKDHDPRMALDGGEDGCDFYRILSREALLHLLPGAAMMMEFGDAQGPALVELFKRHGWRIEEVRKDYSGRERILVARKPDS